MHAYVHPHLTYYIGHRSLMKDLDLEEKENAHSAYG